MTTYSQIVDFRVLGPVQAFRDGEAVPLGGPKQKTVLALLLAARGQFVSMGALISGLYGPDAPPTSKRIIHTYVSNLRSELGDVLFTESDAYRLDASTGRFDAAVFEHEYRAAVDLIGTAPSEGAGRLRDALALWRGHPYADVVGTEALAVETSRLTELRFAAVEARIGADLASGAHLQLVAEVEALVAEHPLREGLVHHLAVALYRSGRQADALRVLSRTRTRLVDELGVQPGPALEDLELKILDHDRALDLPVRPSVEYRAVLAVDLPDDVLEVGASDRDRRISARNERFESWVEAGGGAVIGYRGTAAFAWLPTVLDGLDVANQSVTDGGRAAMDVGDVEVEGGGVSGPPLTRAARLVATCHPGQLLVSDGANLELSASGAVGWTVASLGAQRLQGLEHAMPIFQATRGDTATRFPPLMLNRVPPPVPMATMPVAGYELRRVLREHDFSTEYVAYQQSVGREVVVRVFPPEVASERGFIRRFESEMVRIARIQHPGIVPVIDYWRSPHGAFVVTTPPNHEDLSVFDARGLSPEQRLQVIDSLAAAIAASHREGVVHGALGAQDVMVDPDLNAFVTGMGLAGLTDATGSDAPTDVAALASLAAGVLDTTNHVYPGHVITALSNALNGSEPQTTAGAFRAQLVGDAEQAAMETARNPYKGLRAFGSGDAVDFHGRTTLIGDLAAMVREGSLVFVVGPSGIGKSSLVRAGLIPQVRWPAGDVLTAEMTPGSDPFEALRLSLLDIAVSDQTDAIADLVAGRSGLVDVLLRAVGGSPILLVIDQFEELYTACPDPSRFLDVLAEFAAQRAGSVSVVATLRADFLDRPLTHPRLGAVIPSAIVAVGALSAAELQSAIELPARAVGVEIEQAVTSALITEVGREPGGLPLLQYMLRDLFDQRSGSVITGNDLAGMGGVVETIERRAERTFVGLDDAGRRCAKSVFLRLVSVTEGGEWVRRRARRGELADYGNDAVGEVLNAFGAARLVVFDHDPASRSPTVEVAHESLFRWWPRLAGWIDEIADDLRTERRLEQSAREWTEHDEDASYLVGGARLAQIEEAVDRAHIHLSDTDREFLERSREQQRSVQERRRRVRRRVLAALVSGLVVVSSLAVIAAVQRSSARRQAAESQVEALVNASAAEIGRDPDLPILLALEAFDASAGLPRVPSTVRQALMRSLIGSGLIARADEGWRSVAGDPEGAWFVVDDVDDPRHLHVYGADGTSRIHEIDFGEPVSAVASSPDGSVLAVALGDFDFGTGRDGAPIVLIDTDTWQVSRTVGDSGEYWGLRWSPDARFLVGWGAEIEVWDIGSRDLIARTQLDLLAGVIPGTSTLVGIQTEGDSQFIRRIDLDTGKRSRYRIDSSPIWSMDLSPDGRGFATASFQGRSVSVWRFDEEEPVATYRAAGPAIVRYSPDGSALGVGQSGAVHLLIDLAGGTIRELGGHAHQAEAVGFVGDNVLFTLGGGGTSVWRVRGSALGSGAIQHGPGNPGYLYGVVNSEAGTSTAVVEGGPESVVELVDMSSGVIVNSRSYLGEVWYWPMYAVEGGAVIGLPADRSEPIEFVDLTTDRVEWRGRLCEVPRAASVTARLVMVVADCGQHASGDVSLARSGVINVDTGELVVDASRPGAGPSDLSYGVIGRPGTPSEDLVVTARFSTNELEFWRASTGQSLGTWGSEFSGAVLNWVQPSADHSIAIAGYQTGQIAVFDMQAIRDGASPSSALRFNIQGHSGSVRLAGGSDDWLFTSAAEVRAWDAHTGELIADLGQSDGSAVNVDTAGEALYLEQPGNVLIRIPLDMDELVGLARDQVTRTLTADECERYTNRSNCRAQS
ncbi:MAG: hypothetical protein OEW30_05855 [Acidimicrobiia bacterium]|nr:hypothetical protein [Acidimicrobiia bacterium]